MARAQAMSHALGLDHPFDQLVGGASDAIVSAGMSSRVGIRLRRAEQIDTGLHGRTLRAADIDAAK